MYGGKNRKMAKRGGDYVFVLRNLVTGTMQGDQGEGFEAFRSKGHRPQTKNISLDQVSKDGIGFGLYQNTYVHGNAISTCETKTTKREGRFSLRVG